MSNNWLRHLLGNQTYEPVDNSVDVNSSNTLPGHYPEEQPRNRNGLSSSSYQSGLKALGNWISFLVIKPIIIILILSFRILAKLTNIIYFRDQYSRSNPQNASHLSINKAVMNDPIDKVNKFIRGLEDSLSPLQQLHLESNTTPQLPPFFLGSYTQALYMATNRAKFLFVYLTNPQNENSSVIFNQVITNPEFISLFTSNPNILIWGGDLTNPEAYQLANSLNVTKFPFLGLLCLTRSTTMSQHGPVKTSPKISLILKIQGTYNEDLHGGSSVIEKFKRKIRKFDGELIVMRNELRDKYMSQVLLRQQDINYQNSLRKDQIKKQEKKYNTLKKEYLTWKSAYFNSLTQEGPSEDKAKIAIKLTNGERITFYFPSQNPIDDIFIFVELKNGGYLDSEFQSLLTDEQAAKKFKDFKLDYKFKLVSPLPPRIVLNDYLDEPKNIRDIDCIYPNGLLIVEGL